MLPVFPWLISRRSAFFNGLKFAPEGLQTVVASLHVLLHEQGHTRTKDGDQRPGQKGGADGVQKRLAEHLVKGGGSVREAVARTSCSPVQRRSPGVRCPPHPSRETYVSPPC